MTDINEIIKSQEERLNTESDPSQRLGILFNLFATKKSAGISRGNYINFKKFIDCYVEVVKKGDYGYDYINKTKIESALNYLEIDERASALKYAVSVMAKELPEFDRNWLIEKMNQSEIDQILHHKQYTLYFKALVLFLSNSLPHLLVVLFCSFVAVNVLLLPAYTPNFVLFQITYDSYSDNFYLNHFLNMVTLFADFDNDLKIHPVNGLAVFITVITKIFFLLLIINFLYRKITDKMKVQ